MHPDMNGFSLGDLTRSLLGFVRRKNRAHEAKQWPVVDAIVSSFTLEPDLRGIRPVVLYSYALNNATWHGSCIGFAIKEPLLKKLHAHLNAQPAIRARYDPTDLGFSLVLNRDNPGLPFKVDPDPHLMVMID
jgi:hypothetical protein